MTWLTGPDGLDHVHRRFEGPPGSTNSANWDSLTWCEQAIPNPVFVKEPKKPCLRCEDAAWKAGKK